MASLEKHSGYCQFNAYDVVWMVYRFVNSRLKAVLLAESDNSGEPDDGDEPEATVLLVACGIGLATGAGVVLFNDAILWIRHLAFLQAPVQSVAWGVWARQLSFQSSLLVTALPPTVGGLTVGLLRYLSGKGTLGSACAACRCLEGE